MENIAKRLEVAEADARTLSRLVEQRDEWLEMAEEKIQARNQVIEDLRDENYRLTESRNRLFDWTLRLMKANKTSVRYSGQIGL